MKAIYIISFALCCLNSFLTYSQQLTIKGTVLDESSKEGIEFVTIALQDADSTTMTGCITGKDGCFEIKNVKDDTYILNASFLGYDPKYIKIKIDSSQVIEDIVLKKSEFLLSEVVIEAKRPFVMQKIDRYVVNTSDYLIATGKNGLDILKYTPGLLVQNKNITIMGDNVDIWIDGRPSRMDGNVLSTFLEGLSGDNIDQIEIITNPSSNYDAGGGRSIVNIKMKKNNKAEGLNGSINVGYELSKRHKIMEGIGLNFNSGKVNMYCSYNGKAGKDVSTLEELTTHTTETDKRTFDKSAEFDIDKLISNNYRIGIDITPNEKNTIGFLFNGFNNNENINSNTTTIINPTLEGTSLSQMDGKYKTRLNARMYNMNYNYIFDKKGVDLNIDIDYGYISNKKNQTQDNIFLSSIGNESELCSSKRSLLPQITNVWSANIGYHNSVTETGYWDAGAKISGSKTDYNTVCEELTEGKWENDLYKSNYYKYSENIYAAYVNGGQRFEKIGYQIGMRLEYTVSKGELITTHERNDKNYLRLFPALFLQYMINENHNLVTSYTRRIKRPDYQMLNPFQIALDNYSYISGNPYLKPAYNDNIELKYSYEHKFSITLSRVCNQKMALLEPVIDDKNNCYGYLYNNFGTRNAYICMLNHNSTLFKIWRLDLMGQIAYIKNKSNVSIENFNNDGFSGAVWIGNNFQINKTLSAEISLLMLPYMRIGYIKNDKLNNNLSFGLRKNIMSEKATVILSVNDILGGQSTHDIITMNNININTKENNNLRSFTLSFNYKFGSNKIKGTRNRDIGIEDEIERTSNIKK